MFDVRPWARPTKDSRMRPSERAFGGARRSGTSFAAMALRPVQRPAYPHLLETSTFGTLFMMKLDATTLDWESDSLFQTLVERFSFAESAREWSRCRQRLTAWEDEHLLVDHPPPEKLERHRRTVERLIFFGQLFMLVASHPDFEGLETAEMIRANMEALRDKLRMYHSSMKREEADLILKEVFPEP